ncbi:hypothetical protein D3C81_2048910 [compost metagenome]
MYSPVVAENERLKDRLADWNRQIFTLEDRAMAAEAYAHGLRKENEALRKALEWYADYDNNYDPALIDQLGYLPIDVDGGKFAREALGVPEVTTHDNE